MAGVCMKHNPVAKEIEPGVMQVSCDSCKMLAYLPKVQYDQLKAERA